ncbi:flagellar hook-basal body protein [Brevibacillus daliensis]|uniref:flagellar hook-basal body protein n=1 Tax=Brevibacillus daliensis TaxID=2892995 RepID=UPI001E4C1F27|nr:flagellar hook-basal body protein [Brevibacillus daliensis]
MQSLHISTSALRAVQNVIDVTSNNMANIDTVGYKARDAQFSELLYDRMDKQPDKDKSDRMTATGLPIGSGVKVGMTRLNMAQGSVKQTDNPTDLMIEGNGMFMVRKQFLDANGQVRFENGQPVEEYYATRNGNFHLQMAGNGLYNLVTASGDTLVDDRGIEVELDIPAGGEFSISPTGQIMINGAPTTDSISLIRINNPDDYEHAGQGRLLVATDVAGLANVQSLRPDETTIRQGMLEGSNVEMNQEMIQLMMAQRAYQLNARALSISDQMMSTANMLRSR